MSSFEVPPGVKKLVPETPPTNFNSLFDASDLKGKSVLITGGASGIGLACARSIALQGAFITIADIQVEDGVAAAKEIFSAGGKVGFVVCDVTNYESQAAAFKSAIEFGNGSIDIVIPCAGVIREQSLYDMVSSTEPSLNSTPPEPAFTGVDVNLRGVYYTSYLALHYFKLPPPEDATPCKKSLVLISSLAGYLGYPYSTTYSMSKFRVRGILYGIRETANEAGIRVNIIAPWYIETPMTTIEEPGLNGQTAMLGCAPMENVVDAVVRCAADETVAMRSVMVMPHGNFDLGDDIHGGYGGVVVQEKFSLFLQGVSEKMAAEEGKEMKRRRLLSFWGTTRQIAGNIAWV